MPKRPNANLILDAMRDGDTYDMWGLAMAWAFACNENLYYFGEETSPHYSPSPLGACIVSYEDLEVMRMILDKEVSIEQVKFAAKCLDRYTAWLDDAGLSY